MNEILLQNHSSHKTWDTTTTTNKQQNKAKMKQKTNANKQNVYVINKINNYSVLFVEIRSRCFFLYLMQLIERDRYVSKRSSWFGDSINFSAFLDQDRRFIGDAVITATKNLFKET